METKLGGTYILFLFSLATGVLFAQEKNNVHEYVINNKGAKTSIVSESIDERVFTKDAIIVETVNRFSFISEDKQKVNSWALHLNLGAIRLFKNQPTYSNLQDNINVGLDVGITRTFTNNFFLSSSFTFSIIKDAGLWENPLTYYSANLTAGYKFETNGLTEPYLSIGTSFIGAPNTIDNSSSSFSFNLTAGCIFWLRDSNYGITMDATYKSVSNENMVSHSRISVGVAYKI